MNGRVWSSPRRTDGQTERGTDGQRERKTDRKTDIRRDGQSVRRSREEKKEKYSVEKHPGGSPQPDRLNTSDIGEAMDRSSCTRCPMIKRRRHLETATGSDFA